MKIIFFGAGYCSRFIIPKLPKNAEIICTHNENIKSENFDKSIKLVRLRLSEILKNQKDYLKGTTHILNSISPDISSLNNSFRQSSHRPK